MGIGGSRDQDTGPNLLLQTLDEHGAGINCAVLSEDNSVLATGSEDCTARLWSTKTDYVECIGILKGHEEYINCISIEDTYVLTGSADKTIRKWDMGSCDCVHVFCGHSSLVNRIICTGDFIFSSSYDRTVRCWDFDSGECIRVFGGYQGHKRGVYPLIFIPAEQEEITPDSFNWEGNRDVLITGSADFTAKAWSFETGRVLKTFKGHTGAITCMESDSSGRAFFSGSTDQTIRSWDIVRGTVLKVFEGHQGSVICISVCNKIMYSGSSDHTVRSWVTEFGDCMRVFKGHQHTVSCLKVIDGLIFTGCGDGASRIFESKTANLKRTLPGHRHAVNVVQVVDNKLFTCSHDGSIRVWNIEEARQNRSGEVSESGVRNTAIILK